MTSAGNSTPDDETRARLLRAGVELFAERGFQRVTVRDICRAAQANVAAVNYYFGGKLGLYQQIVREALAALRGAAQAIEAPLGTPAPERLRLYVRSYIPRIARPEGAALLMQRIMSHEMQDPTPVAPQIARSIILPRIEYLSTIVAELLACSDDDPRVGRCVMSLQAQCLFYLPNRFRRAALKQWDKAMAADLDAAAEHIAEFSLAGIAHMACANLTSTNNA